MTSRHGFRDATHGFAATVHQVVGISTFQSKCQFKCVIEWCHRRGLVMRGRSILKYR